MKIENKTTYTTTILEVEHNEELYTVRHSEDFDGYFIKEWEILNEEGDFIQEGNELYKAITDYAKNYFCLYSNK